MILPKRNFQKTDGYPQNNHRKRMYREYGSPINSHVFITDQETRRDKDILALRRELTRQCPNSTDSFRLTLT